MLADRAHRVRHLERLADLICRFGRNLQPLAEQCKLENDGVIERALARLAGVALFCSERACAGAGASSSSFAI
jgi:hypothetical protein